MAFTIKRTMRSFIEYRGASYQFEDVLADRQSDLKSPQMWDKVGIKKTLSPTHSMADIFA